jgi:glycosyltransferase involved in cell wall biosynthesis
MSKVSVIIPAYNRANIIEDALNSVFEQTHRPLELIVVDDGSKDDTVAVVEGWIQQHAGDADFTARLITQANQRAPAARNRGIRESTGDYIQFLDSDDILYPDTIRQKLEAIAETGRPYAYCRNHQLNSEGEIVGQCGSAWPKEGRGAIATYLFHTSGPLWPRAVFDSAGFWDESLVATDEIELYARLKMQLGQGAFVSEYGHAQRDHSGERVSRSGGIGPDPSAYRVIEKLFAMIEGSDRDCAVERNAIARFGTGCVEAYALSGEYGWAGKCLALSSRIAVGRKKYLLFSLNALRGILPNKWFFPLFMWMRSKA